MPRARSLLAFAVVVAASAGCTPVAAPTTTTSALNSVIRISTRTAPYTDSSGHVWEAERGFTGGYQVNSVTTNPIASTPDSPLYQSEHWGMSSFSSVVPASSTYNVTLKMAEDFYSSANLRRFSVTAEGRTVVSDLDLYAVAGKYVAHDVTFSVPVTDGHLDLGFSSTVDHAKLDAISITMAGSSTTPPPAPTTTAPPVPAASTNPSGLSWMSGASGNGVSDGSYAAWRGRKLDIAGSWADVPGASTNLWQLQPGFEYAADKWQGNMDLAVGALVSGETWGNAAGGAYDARWKESLTNLKNLWGARPGTVYIRFAHEMNGNWYPWSVNSSNYQDFMTSWKRYRALQKSIMPQAKLVFSVNRESVSTGMDWRKFFPGSAYVDVMSVDYYNQYPFVATTADWNSSVLQYDAYGAPKGLQRHLEFANSVGLPLAVSEWSNNADDGDSPAFIQSMFAFFKANAGTTAGKLLYDVQFDVDQDNLRWALYPSTRAPLAAAAYRNTW